MKPVLRGRCVKKTAVFQASLIAVRLKRDCAAVRVVHALRAWAVTLKLDCATKSMLAPPIAIALNNNSATRRRVAVMTRTVRAAPIVTAQRR